MPNINNATPRVIDQGIRPLETPIIRAIRRTYPQHLPVWHTFAEKGPIGRRYLDMMTASFTEVYGDKTLEAISPYYTSVTPFIQGTLAEANNCIIHRVFPQDGKDPANVVLFLDVLETEVPVYVKNTDGSIKYDDNGLPEIEQDTLGADMMVKGYNVMYVTESFENPLHAYRAGKQTQRKGVQSENGKQSTQYPLFEFAARWAGDAGNRVFQRLWALNNKEPGFPDYLLNTSKQYPYQFSLGELMSELTGETTIKPSRMASTSVTFTMKEGGVNSMTSAVTDGTTQIHEEYIRRQPAMPESDLGKVHFYYDNINELAAKFSEAESAVVDEYRDPEVDGSAENIHCLNMLSFTSSNLSPYQAIKLVDVPGVREATRLTRNTDIYLGAGNSGTMTQETLEEAIRVDMNNYANIMSPYMDQAMHPESVIYDTGYALPVKKSMANFIALRKDTLAMVSTFVNGTEISIEEQFAIGIGINTHFQMFPESAFFGTSTVRAAIFAGSSTLLNSPYTKRIPLIYEMMRMCAGYMGAANGAFVTGKIFDSAPGNVCRYTSFEDTDIVNVPVPSRVQYWTNGINFVLNFSSDEKFFPAARTIYKHDGDVNTSLIVAFACCTINKSAHKAWRQYTGNMSLKPETFVSRVNTFVSDDLRNRFDDLFTVIPRAFITETGNNRRWGWELPVTLVAPNMMTVMTTRTETQNFRDYQG